MYTGDAHIYKRTWSVSFLRCLSFVEWLWGGGWGGCVLLSQSIVRQRVDACLMLASSVSTRTNIYTWWIYIIYFSLLLSSSLSSRIVVLRVISTLSDIYIVSKISFLNFHANISLEANYSFLEKQATNLLKSQWSQALRTVWNPDTTFFPISFSHTRTTFHNRVGAETK